VEKEEVLLCLNTCKVLFILISLRGKIENSKFSLWIDWCLLLPSLPLPSPSLPLFMKRWAQELQRNLMTEMREANRNKTKRKCTCIRLLFFMFVFVFVLVIGTAFIIHTEVGRAYFNRALIHLNSHTNDVVTYVKKLFHRW
jgi:hypothetical protein